MGLVKKDEAKAEEAAPEPEPEIVKKLKETEDKILKLQQDYERQLQALVIEYTKKQQPYWDERKKVLCAEEGSGEKVGTPACDGFWLKAMKAHPALGDMIQEWDEPVLRYLQDLEYSFVDPEDDNKGFKLKFVFAENPYFTNATLEKEYRTQVKNPYCGEQEVLGISSSTVEWKEGKDVTVEKIAKKVKGGGAKKAKQKKEKEGPRRSFFRDFFKELKPGMDLSEDQAELAQMMMQAQDDSDDEADPEDNEALVAQLMDVDHEQGGAIKDDLIPRAIRWYTGEACPDDSDDDFDEDDEEEDEDDSEEESSAPKGKAKAAAKKKGGGGEAKKEEECKQQ